MAIRLSIRSKIIWIVLAVTTFSLASSLAFLLVSDLRRFQWEMKENARALSILLAEISSSHLLERRQEASTQLLERLRDIAYVDSAYIFDRNGMIFSKFTRVPQQNDAPQLPQSDLEFSNQMVHAVRNIQSENLMFGKIYLRTSREFFQAKIRNRVITFGSLLLLMVFLSILIAGKLQKIVSRPILELTDAARVVTETVDFSVRVKRESMDEIGTLYVVFNKMLNRIQKREEERNQAVAALTESEERYRTLVESSSETIYVQQNGNLAYINPAGLHLLGYETSADITPDTAASMVVQFPDSPIPSLFETKWVRKNGKYIEVEGTLIETVYQGNPALQGLVRDVTEKKQQRIAAERMKRLAALGEISAQIAHEVRNSLGSIQLNVRILSDHVHVPTAYDKNLHNIQLGIERIEDIISGILHFARPAPPSVKKVALHTLLENSMSVIEKELATSDVALIRKYDQNLPELTVDSNQIHQVLLNLCLNARDSMSGEGVVEVRVIRSEDSVEICIRDDGEGIPPENLEKIFDPFFTTKQEGTGLGLAIVARILEQHEAQILVESEVGRGSQFRIRFPLMDE